MFISIFIIFIIIMAVVLYFKHLSDNEIVATRTYNYVEPERTRLPKISAEVDNKLYGKAKNYCEDHHLTMSDLIRKAVNEYIDNN